MLAKLFELFRVDPLDYQRKAEEAWLAKSVDLVDLERRQRQLTYGQKKTSLFQGDTSCGRIHRKKMTICQKKIKRGLDMALFFC